MIAMLKKHSHRIMFIRFSFLVLVAFCVWFQVNALVDYVVVISFIMLVCGIFPISNVAVMRRELKIQKHYFWALFEKQLIIDLEQITSLKEIDSGTDFRYGSQSFLEWVIWSVLMTSDKYIRAEWTVVKIVYQNDGLEETVQVKMTKENWDELIFRVDDSVIVR